MSLPLIFRRAARAEFDDAADWYEQRQVGLGAAFTTAVQLVLDRVIAQPDFYPQVYSAVREAPVAGFPYCVYYRVRAGRLVVIAVYHQARDPGGWRGRV